MNTVGFQSILILLAAAVVLVALFRSLRLPQILAYLCVGILVGPRAAGWAQGAPEWRPRRNLARCWASFANRN